MKYFSFPRTCWTRHIFYSKRSVSYLAKKNLEYLFMNHMDELCHGNVMNIINSKKEQYCSQFTIRVLANGALESNGALVQLNHSRYLFNCGEGIQRSAGSYGFKLSGLNSVFITHHSWKNIGGILGLALTQQALGSKELFVYGPPSIRGVIRDSRSFVQLKTLCVHVVTEEPNWTFDDNFLKLRFVPLYKNYSNAPHKSTSDSIKTQDSDSDEEFSESKQKNDVVVSKAETSTVNDSSYVLCYIGRTPDYGGHLDPVACQRLGVPPGKLYGILKKKQDIVLENNRVVKWTDVMVSEAKSKSFIIVDCPTENYLEALINEPQFIEYQKGDEDVLSAVVHFTSAEIMNHPKYREWMGRFPLRTKHLVMNCVNTPVDIPDVHRIQEKLHILHPTLFPKLKENNFPVVKDVYTGKIDRNKATLYLSYNEENEIKVNDKQNHYLFSAREVLNPGLELFDKDKELIIIRAIPSLILQFHPKTSFDCSHKMFLDPLFYVEEFLNFGNVRKELTELKEFTSNLEATENYKNLTEFPKIIFLGTGSSVPSKTRATSGILIQVDEENIILMDCAENTYSQLRRFFGNDKLPEIFSKLKLIYISHHHADHHLGLINILKIRQKLSVQSENVNNSSLSQLHDTTSSNTSGNHIYIMIPNPLLKWLRSNEELDPSLLCNTTIMKNETLIEPKLLNDKLRLIGLSEFKTCQVPHCQYSYGVTISDLNGYKITYSGDCQPSENLISIGKNSDILIHEATFEDGLESMAKKKYHSTISQAIDVGRRMNARFTMLTHFSQRYSHIPQITSDLPNNVSIAFDNMVVNEKVLPILPKLIKFYKDMFPERVSELNNKTIKITKQKMHQDQSTMNEFFFEMGSDNLSKVVEDKIEEPRSAQQNFRKEKMKRNFTKNEEEFNVPAKLHKIN